jgi:hypothetical protein
MNHKEQMLDDLGKLITALIRTVEVGGRLNLKVAPGALIDDLLACKNLVNKLKGKESESAE